MKKFSSPKQKLGLLGENIACKYLVNRGFVILERNFTLKMGEIDIICKKADTIHFVEVKSVSFEASLEKIHTFRPEDQMSYKKRFSLLKMVNIYVFNNKIDKWQFDLICVYLNNTKKNALVRLLDNLILNE